MAVRLDFEIAWDARKVQGLEKGISSLTKETSLFEKAFGKASKTVVHEAALMDASLQKLLSTLKAVSAETRSVRIPSGGRGAVSGSYVTGGSRRSGKSPEQEAADSLAAQKRYYRNKALADAQRIADAKMMAAQEAAILRKQNAAEERAAADSLAAQKRYYRNKALADAQRIADAKMMAAQEAAILRKQNAAEERAAAESLAAQKEYYLRKNATDAYRERERRIMATRAARQEAAELRARGQDARGAGLFDMAMEESSDRTSRKSQSAIGAAANRHGARSSSSGSAIDESFFGTLKSASKMNSGGPLFNTAKFLADINALPFGYERYGVRMAKTAELGMTIFAKWGTRITLVGGALGAAAASVGVLRGAITNLADSGDRDAQRLASALSRVPGPLETAKSVVTSLTEAFYGTGRAASWALSEIINKTPGATGVMGVLADAASSVFPDRSGERGGAKMAAGRRMGDAAESARQREAEHRRELERIKDEEDARVLAEKKKSARNREVMGFADLSGMAEGSNEYKAKMKDIGDIQAEIVAINAQEEELHKRRIERAEDEMKKRLETEAEVSKLAKKARDEMKNGRQFDIDRVVHAKDLNQQLEIQIQQMEKLAREGKLTDEEKQERQQRIADILARQRQEEAHILELERARSGFALEIAQAQMDAGIDGIQRQAGFAREMIGHGSNYLDMLKRTNQISERQYNILKMQIAANPVEIEALKKEQAVEKEKLELARKKAAQDAKNAKTAQERMDAEKEHLRIVGQMQVQEVNHARQRAAAEENVAKAQRDQLAAQEMVRQQRAAENAQKVGEQRMGAVQEQMQQQGPNQAAVQRQMFQGRMRSAVAEREKELGRKLNRREQAELYNEQRGQFVRDLRGPSDAQVRREAGRQRGDERRAAREANAANANLPPGLRAAENRFGAGQRANQEAARQEQIRSGAMRQAMMTGVNQEQAGAAGELAKQQIQILQQQGQLTEAQAEMMQQQVDFNTQMLQGQQAMMQLLQNVTMAINGQAQAAQANQQRARAQRAGNPR